MIFDLISDLAVALEEMPTGHSRRLLVSDIGRLLRKRVNELDRHPTTLFQELWNGMLEAPVAANWSEASPSRSHSVNCDWMQACFAHKSGSTPEFPWLRLVGASHAPSGWDETILTVSPVIKVAMSPDERYLCSGDMLRAFNVWDARTHALLVKIDLDDMTGNPSLIEFSSDSRYLAVTTGDGEIAVVDWRAGSVVFQNREISSERRWGFRQAWFSPDLATVTFVGRWGDVFEYRLYGGTAGELLRQFKSPAPQGVYRNCGLVFWTLEFYEIPPTDESSRNLFVKPGVYHIYRVDIPSGVRREVLQVEGAQSQANLVVSPDGSRLAWCESDQIQVFDGVTGQLLSRIKAPPREGQHWWSFRYGEFGKPSECQPVWSTDSRHIAALLSSSMGNLHHSHAQVWVWDTDTGEVHWHIPMHGQLTNLKSMALSAGGRRLLHDARGCQLLIQSPSQREVLPGLCAWDEQIVSFSLAENGRIAACADHAGRVHLLDLGSHRRVTTLPAEMPRKVEYLQISADGEQLAWWQREKGPHQLFRADTADLSQRPAAQGLPGSLQFTADGNLIVSAGKELLCVPTQSPGDQFRVRMPSATSSYYELSPDNRWIAAASHQTCFWKLSREDAASHLLGADDRSDPRGFHLSADGHRFVVRAHRVDASSRFLMGVMDLELDTLVWEHEELEKLVTHADCGPGPDCVTFAKRPGILRLVNVVSKTVVAEARISNAEMYGVAVSRDGRWIAGAGYDGQVRLVDLQQGGAVSLLHGYEKNVLFVQFDHSGTRLLTNGEVARDGTGRVQLWNTLTQQVEFAIDHPQRINSASLSPDGQQIACACGDQTLRLWRVGRAEPAWEMWDRDLESNSLHATVGWSPDGTFLTHISTPGSVVERDLRDGSEVRRWALPAASVLPPEYTPDGESLIVCGNSPVVHLHDARSGEPIRLLRGHSQPVTKICFAARSALCATFSNDGQVIVWNTDTGEKVARRRFTFDHGPTRLAYLASDARVLMESPKGITAWNLADGGQLNNADALNLLAEARVDGFSLLTRSMQSGFEIRCRRTARPLAWQENRSSACEMSCDGSRWALLDQGRLMLFILCFGGRPFDGHHPVLDAL